MRRVVKFGGTSIASPELMRAMAEKVKVLRDGGDEVLVVVSAMGKSTNELLGLLRRVTEDKTPPRTADLVASFGERLSANLMAASLTSLGVTACAITPENPDWPVVGRAVESRGLAEEKVNQTGYALVDLAESKLRWGKRLENLIKAGEIPVICGFLALDQNGSVITLGRGGSDISAFIIGRLSRADEVVIVTDVEGVMKGDPRQFGGQAHLEKISIKELVTMARTGARVVHPEALGYKLPGQRARIVHYDSPTFVTGGTEVVGHVESDVFKTGERLASVTVVGDDFISTGSHGLLNKLTDRLAALKISIFGVSLSDQFMGIYVPEAQADLAYRSLFETAQAEPRFKAVSMRKGIARIKLSSPAFVEEPGIIGRVGDLLAQSGINIIEMLTIHTDITIFLEDRDLDQAFKILKEVTL